MVEQGLVELSTPVRELLPAGTVARPFSGRELTLLDLSSQHSGLPRMPANFNPADPFNPYADDDAQLLYAFMGHQGVAILPHVPFVYSNLGVGLLGQALANCAGKPYPLLLHEKVTSPLGMHDTSIKLSHAHQARFVQGYSPDHRPAHPWDLDALAGAGAIRSTAHDMLTYLESYLHPDRLPSSVKAFPDGSTLAASIAASCVLHGEAGPGMHIGLNWFYNDSAGAYWHNGGTGGFSSYAQFNQNQDYALIVLCNTASNSFTDTLGIRIAQQFEGKPANPVQNWR